MRAQFTGAVALGWLAVLGGCGPAARPPSPPAPWPSSPSAPWPASLPPDAGRDEPDPSAVCARFTDAVFRADTVADAGPADAYRRAAAYTTAQLAAAFTAPPRGSARWTVWRRHEAAIDPVVTTVPAADGQPVDGVREAYRAAQAVLTPTGRDGWRGPTERYVVFCTLHAEGGRWRIAGYDIAAGPDRRAP